MKNMTLQLTLQVLFLLSSSQDIFANSPELIVGSAKEKKSSLLISKWKGSGLPLSAADQVALKIQKNFQFLEEVRVTLSDEVQSPGELEKFKAIPSDFVAYGQVDAQPGNQIALEVRLSKPSDPKDFFAKKYISDLTDTQNLADTVSNDLYQAMMGKKGIFRTMIVMVCEKDSKKEIFLSRFDGTDVQPITALRSIALTPNWSPDGKKIAFSVYNRHSDGTRNIDLFEMDLISRKMSVLSNKKGINSGASYRAGTSEMVMTMSFEGNPDLYLLDTKTKQAKPLTRSLSFDVDAAFSPDGSKIAFVSSRAGKPMIYISALSEMQSPKRVTFAGQYNAAPQWSPDGKSVVFAGWIDRHFDLFILDVDQLKIERLTKNEGNNEDPSYSPNGQHIVFSSNRKNGKKIWITDTKGSFAKELTINLKNCTSPKWSPFL